MLNDKVLFEDPIENGQRPAAVDHVILRDNFEPTHHRFFLEDVLVMRDAQTDTDPVFGMSIESIGWHWIAEYAATAPIFVEKTCATAAGGN